MTTSRVLLYFFLDADDEKPPIFDETTFFEETLHSRKHLVFDRGKINRFWINNYEWFYKKKQISYISLMLIRPPAFTLTKNFH
jgi:hypothetical protein